MNDFIKKLSRNGHIPGNEFELATKLNTWLSSNDIELADVIVFPGCGCGAYEMTFLEVCDKQSKSIVFCDNDIQEEDLEIWHILNKDILIMHSLQELCDNLERLTHPFSLIFFHQSRDIMRDENYYRLLKLCEIKCVNPYIHAFYNNDKCNIYSCSWKDLLCTVFKKIE